MGGSKVKTPKPTQAELQIQSLQLEMLRQQVLDTKMIRPFIFKQLGLIEIIDPKTGQSNIRKMTDAEYRKSMTKQELNAYNNLLLSQERESKALKGELPLTEAGQQQKRDEFKAFKEAMSRKGDYIEGDTPETSTAKSTSGTQGLKAFQERWGLVEDSERRGEIDRGTSLVLNRMGVASDIGARNYGMGTGFSSLYSPFYAGSSAALDPYQRYASMNAQANMYNAGQRASGFNRLFDFGETAGGLGLYKAFGL